MGRVSHYLVAAFVAIISFWSAAGAQETTDTPSALTETYEDWTVSCGRGDDGRHCMFSQQQARQDGQRVLGIELAPAAEGSLRGTLVMPFGLQLDKGVTFAVDDMATGKPSAFKTCLPVGCIVPLIFTAATAKALRTGRVLKLAAVASRNGKDVAFSVSLKGFGTAFDRTRALAK